MCCEQQPQASEIAVCNGDKEKDATEGNMGNGNNKREASESTVGKCHRQVKWPWAMATARGMQAKVL